MAHSYRFKNPRRLIAWLPCLALLWLAACLPVQAQMPMPPSDTPTPPAPSQTPTPTTVWFPPTATPTPLPTATFGLTPTVDIRPELGAKLFSDQFPEDAPWSLGPVGGGRTAIGGSELSLAVTANQGYVYSLRDEPQLDNFYLEITASPSICRGQDEYGLLLRVSKELNCYRFALTCDGRVRVDKLHAGRTTSPEPLQYHGAVPPGAPSSSRLAVLANGSDLSFFVNGEFLFTLSDSALVRGKLGVFARADGEDALTVNFSDLVVNAVP